MKLKEKLAEIITKAIRERPKPPERANANQILEELCSVYQRLRRGKEVVWTGYDLTARDLVTVVPAVKEQLTLESVGRRTESQGESILYQVLHAAYLLGFDVGWHVGVQDGQMDAALEITEDLAVISNEEIKALETLRQKLVNLNPQMTSAELLKNYVVAEIDKTLAKKSF